MNSAGHLETISELAQAALVRTARKDPGSLPEGIQIELTAEDLELRRTAAAKVLLPQTEAFLRRIGRDAVAGGRYSDLPTKIFAHLLGLYREGPQTVIVSAESERALKAYQRIQGVDDQLLEAMALDFVCERANRSPELRRRLLDRVGIREVANV